MGREQLCRDVGQLDIIVHQQDSERLLHVQCSAGGRARRRYGSVSSRHPAGNKSRSHSGEAAHGAFKIQRVPAAARVGPDPTDPVDCRAERRGPCNG
jgi:hypothetical protein